MNQQTTDGARARQRAAGRHFLLTLAGALGLLACAAAPASAANLILDTGAEVTLSGEHVYDIVNVDNNARIELAADAVIRAKQVYIGPTAVLATCWVPGGNGNQDNGCVNGRSLAIVSEGPLVVARGISLQGGTGAARNGGSLTLYGSSVVVGGPITTVGIATAPNIASSGNVEIRSAGSVVTEAINAAGASVTIAGGSILVGGGIDVDPDTNGVNPISPPGAYGSSNARGGAVAVDSTGDVTVSGAILASGLNGVAGYPFGGPAGSVSIKGSDVTIGNVTVRPGTGAGLPAGPPGAFVARATGSLVTGNIDVSGAAGVGSAPGGSVDLSATGATTTGTITANGAVAAGSGVGSAGGNIVALTGSGSFGALTANGSNANGAGNPGGAGGRISITGTGAMVTGAASAAGGNSSAGADGAAGGSVDIRGNNVSTGAVNANAGTTGRAGAKGGTIVLWANGNLSVGSATGNGASATANGSSNAATATLPGGAGGRIILRAAAGTFASSGVIRANGFNGGAASGATRAGAGGPGGDIDIVATHIGAVGSVLAIGGNSGSGTTTGPTSAGGGAGGTVRVWSDEDPGDGRTTILTTGGTGVPLGPDGARIVEMSPSGLTVDTEGSLAFTSRSPDADGYRVFRSVNGAPVEAVVDATGTSGVAPPPPPSCVPVTYTVQAFETALGWLSLPIGPVAFTKQPSATQLCTDAPKIKVGKALKVKLKALKKSKWKVNVTVQPQGAGTLLAKLFPKKITKKTKPFVTVTRPVLAPTKVKIALILPKGARKAGTYTIRFETKAPVGKASRSATVKLEVLK